MHSTSPHHHLKITHVQSSLHIHGYQPVERKLVVIVQVTCAMHFQNGCYMMNMYSLIVLILYWSTYGSTVFSISTVQ